MPLTIVWFRRDLRLADNPALNAAADRGDAVLPVYLSDWEEGSTWAPGAAGRWWLGESLLRLSADLQRAGTPLRVLSGDPAAVLPELARAHGAEAVVWNALYEPWARDLDAQLSDLLAQRGVQSYSHPACLLFEPEGHVSSSGRPYVQFGAFWRSCLSLPEPRTPSTSPSRLIGLPRDEQTGGSEVALSSSWRPGGTESGFVWEPGEEGARRRLDIFLDEALEDYPETRDYPAIEGVSRLSPHLHFGEISPHHVWHAVKDRAHASRSRTKDAGPGGIGGRSRSGARMGEGADVFLRQLGWREFAHYLLYHFPHTTSEPFREEFSRFAWAEDAEGLAAWQEGLTGFSLVDAGMRQLLAEGWMHNRVRMVVASFLTKDLLVPWQEGAAWFWDHLVDADLANNTLGWQWTAGSGPDAAPYFRVYNPTLQAKRFDRKNAYVERWLEGRSSTAPPILDHALARLEALEAFREMRSG